MSGDYNTVAMLAIADRGADEALERIALEIDTLEAIHRGLASNATTAGDPRTHALSALEALDRCMASLKEITR